MKFLCINSLFLATHCALFSRRSCPISLSASVIVVPRYLTEFTHGRFLSFNFVFLRILFFFRNDIHFVLCVPNDRL